MAAPDLDHPSIQQHQQEKKAFTSYGSMSSLGGLSNHGSSSWSEERRGNKAGAASLNRWRPSVFDFKAERNGSTCPTCKGAGRIPKGEEQT